VSTAPEAPARYVRLGRDVVVRVGSLAGTAYLHSHAPDGTTGTQCLACFGWVTDPRHVFHRIMPVEEKR